MDIAKIDKNFAKTKITETDVVWRNALDGEFDMRGVFFNEDAGCYYRMDKAIADQVNFGVSGLAPCTAGGRLRFKTNSPYIAVRAKTMKLNMSWNQSLFGRCGFTVYANGLFDGRIVAQFSDWENAENGVMYYDDIYHTKEKGVYDVEICFPSYCEKIYSVEIGLKEGCDIFPATPYKYNEKPVVFYGSSITQGGCASRAGNDYISLVCRWLDTDFWNLGFSGSAKGEPIMAEYVAAQKASVFVIDYDHNAPTLEHLEKTHMPMYRTIRAKNPNTPIIFMSRPNFYYDVANSAPRRDLIKANYLTAKAEGDNNVYFLDGELLFGKENWDACTVDMCHPNDLGFYRMAKALYPILKQALETSVV